MEMLRDNTNANASDPLQRYTRAIASLSLGEAITLERGIKDYPRAAV